jgi:hypothetical protein
MNNSTEINTFIDLYQFLQAYQGNFKDWLESSWKGKDKQESVLRLFAGLGLIDKLKKYKICKGNFNEATIIPHINKKDVFYTNKNIPINIKDKGDKSDLHGQIIENEKKIVMATTSKNLKDEHIGDLDLRDIKCIFYEKYKGWDLHLCLCIRDSTRTKEMISRVCKANSDLQELLEKNTTIIIDWNDLCEAKNQFNICYGNIPIENILNNEKKPILIKMHQEISILKTIKMKETGVKNILWGHIPRSGKSYIMGGCIINDSKNKKECNYLVMTTAPNETIKQYITVFNCLQLSEFNVVYLNGKNKNPEIKEKNIFICSKQFLQTKLETEEKEETEEKTKSIAWLKKIDFDMRFLDESHNGGTTELAKKTLETYGNKSFTVQITATYSKPVNDYNIEKKNWILWDLEDITLCKKIYDEKNLNRLIEKHGEECREIIKKYSIPSMIEEYSKYPELFILSDKINSETIHEIIEQTRDNNYGWSIEACFLLKQSLDSSNNIITIDEFQNKEEALKPWYRIFGKKSRLGVPDKEYPANSVFIKRIEKICKSAEINSRFIGDSENPTVIIAFLPQTNIDELSRATVNLLLENNVIPDYDIIYINSKITGNPKETIENAEIKAKNNGKKGLLVLSGKQCSLGVSLDNCDIVLLLNNTLSFDMIYQMMFRCMTGQEDTSVIHKKKCGFVVDLNLQRVINTSIIDYASITQPTLHTKDAVKYILQERLINLNGDDWMPCFGNDVNILNKMTENIYDLYSSNTELVLNKCLDKLTSTQLILTDDEQTTVNKCFTYTYIKNPKSKITVSIRENDNDTEEEDEDEKINKGIEKILVSADTENNKETINKEEINVSYTEILRHIIPLICVLSINNPSTLFVDMYRYIEKIDLLYTILNEQIISWWGKKINTKHINIILDLYIKYMQDNRETSQIIRTIKELFVKNRDNRKEFSKLIDKYFEATEIEKNSNAEITTIFALRQESLSKVPSLFWKSPKKVIEPCCGKGGYVIDIIELFMNGLVDYIADPEKRYKYIVEECVYFCDINKTNIFITRLLIDPNNKYKLNYYEGNTLKLNPSINTETWKGTEKFNLHVCNPPYEENNEGGRKALNHNLWSDFLNWSYKYLYDDGYMLYITPTSWMSPTSKNKEIFYKNYILYLNINECKKHFNVGSTFSYYIIQKTNEIHDTEIVCEYGKKIYKSKCNLKGMDYLPNFTTLDTISIIRKFKENNLNKISFKTSCELHNTTHAAKLKDIENDVFKFPVRHTTKRNIRYSSVKHSLQDNEKILLNLSGNLNPIYDDGKIGFTQAQMYLLTDKKEYVDILNSKLYKFVFNICKWSGFNIEKIYHNIPFIETKKTDNEIYNIFGLTEEEIKMCG